MPVRGLAIETSGRAGSVALMSDGTLIVHREFPHGLKNAATLLPLIAEMLDAQGLTPRQVDELYVSTGPGSFTGLRIAVTLAKTWWLTLGTPIVAVPSVRAIAENAPPDVREVAVVLDAKRGQVFTASYERDAQGQWSEVLHARLDTLTEAIKRQTHPFLIGEGLDYHAVPEGVRIAQRETWSARADAVGRLGHAAARRGEFADALTLTPTYIRLAEAEEKWAAKQIGAVVAQGK